MERLRKIQSIFDSIDVTRGRNTHRVPETHTNTIGKRDSDKFRPKRQNGFGDLLASGLPFCYSNTRSDAQQTPSSRLFDSIRCLDRIFRLVKKKIHILNQGLRDACERGLISDSPSSYTPSMERTGSQGSVYEIASRRKNIQVLSDSSPCHFTHQKVCF